MDFTLFNKIYLLSPESLEELRLFINSLLKKQEKQTAISLVKNKTIEPNSLLPKGAEDAIPINPLAEMEQIPVSTDIIIDRYSIYEDNFINRL